MSSTCRYAQVINNWGSLDKLEPKTTTARVVGFTSRRNTYRVLLETSGRVIETCDLVFSDEHKSYTCKAQPNLSAETGTAEITLNSGAGQGNDEVCSTDSFEWMGSGGAFETAREQVRSSTIAEARARPHSRPFCTGAELERFFDQYRLEDREEAKSDGQLDASAQLILESEASSQPETGAQLTLEESVSTETADSGEAPLPPTRNTSLHLVMSPTVLEPESYEQALDGPNNRKWREAIDAELQAHVENNTWTVVKAPSQHVTPTAKWVFQLKKDAAGNVERYKARLVARGFQQRQGRDFGETFAPVASLDTVRTMIAITAIKDYHMLQFDVSTAFLNGVLSETVYVDPPKGVQVADDECLKLNKALYGLKQAGRTWSECLSQALVGLDMTATESEPCLFVSDDRELLLVVYVDDGLIMGKDGARCAQLLEKLAQKFKVKELKCEMFLGIELRRENGSIPLAQTRYIDDVLSRFNMINCKGATSPIIDARTMVSAGDDEETSAPYREAVGCLMFIANCTRPDISFATCLLARFCHAPTKRHWSGVQRVMQYLKHTRLYRLKYYRGEQDIRLYSDADWASEINDRHSTSGVFVFLGGGPIIFSSRKQSAVAQSSTEAEFIAANEAVKDLMWLSQLLAEIGYSHSTPVLAIDNQSTIKQIENQDTKRRSRHIELRHRLVRKQLQSQLFSLTYIASDCQPADILTKPIGGAKLTQLLDSTKIVDTMRTSAVVAAVALILVGASSIKPDAPVRIDKEGPFASVLNCTPTHAVSFLADQTEQYKARITPV